MHSLNERLSHLVHDEISHSKAFELLQEIVSNKIENKNKLRSKDEITLLETLLEIFS